MRGKRIPDETRKIIIKKLKNGEKTKEIAKEVGISPYTIKNIKSNELYLSSTNPTSVLNKGKKITRKFQERMGRSKVSHSWDRMPGYHPQVHGK